MNDVLAKHYPQWIADCVESARWLRSPEYDGKLNPEQCEAKAQEYERKAEQYRQKLNNAKEQHD